MRSGASSRHTDPTRTSSRSPPRIRRTGGVFLNRHAQEEIVDRAWTTAQTNVFIGALLQEERGRGWNGPRTMVVALAFQNMMEDRQPLPTADDLDALVQPETSVADLGGCSQRQEEGPSIRPWF
ncbi:UNVERIFIED_CONTAM: hypothetical protein Sindi_0715900 [Sesamum indicum]